MRTRRQTRLRWLAPQSGSRARAFSRIWAERVAEGGKRIKPPVAPGQSATPMAARVQWWLPWRILVDRCPGDRRMTPPRGARLIGPRSRILSAPHGTPVPEGAVTQLPPFRFLSPYRAAATGRYRVRTTWEPKQHFGDAHDLTDSLTRCRSSEARCGITPFHGVPTSCATGAFPDSPQGRAPAPCDGSAAGNRGVDRRAPTGDRGSCLTRRRLNGRGPGDHHPAPRTGKQWAQTSNEQV